MTVIYKIKWLASANYIEQTCKYLQTDAGNKALINISKPNLSY